MDPIELSLFSHRIQAVCEEMGAVVKRAAFSPNIKDRLDFSCAVFDRQGRLCAQAAHIPVHLGSMAYAMIDIVRELAWDPGDMVILNDPFLGGTHLPDVTLIAPFFHQDELCGFLANRAHHADIGCGTPGSMPLVTRLEDEGVIIAPTKLMEAYAIGHAFAALTARMRNPQLAEGDFRAQISANQRGLERLAALVKKMGLQAYLQGLKALQDYAETIAADTIDRIPHGDYAFRDFMDDDGQGNEHIPIEVTVRVRSATATVDFARTSNQVTGNINCPLSVTAAAVYYVFYALMPEGTPACAGSFRPITINAPAGCLLNAQRPAAVAAGNVETSTRVVDALLGALAQAIPDKIPAASHGSMNNIALGGPAWDYYETVGGGMGAHSRGDGLSAVQTHMTNTLNTPIEVVEMCFPLRITRYQIRRGSGGCGAHRGGDGIIREFEFRAPTSVTVLGERRTHVPWGLRGGNAAEPAETLLNGVNCAPKFTLSAGIGDRLTIRTGGGGGWGPTAPRR